MVKLFMPDLAEQDERMKILRDNNDGVDETSYIRPLSQEERDIKRETHLSNCWQLGLYEEELAKIKKEFKAKMEPLQIENKVLIKQVITGQEECKGTIYHVFNHDDGMCETYDDNGELVGTRRLRPDEKQRKLYPIQKVSNDQ